MTLTERAGKIASANVTTFVERVMAGVGIPVIVAILLYYGGEFADLQESDTSQEERIVEHERAIERLRGRTSAQSTTQSAILARLARLEAQQDETLRGVQRIENWLRAPAMPPSRPGTGFGPRDAPEP